uniref:CHK domain-containing protein n=1 Tax=Haemonchus contortus TaxID=6289 RepID=A0A7I4YXU0_HAECO
MFNLIMRSSIQKCAKIQGLMSKICLISPDWKSELRNVPQIFIVKICSQLSMVENQAIMDNKDFIDEDLIKQFENYIKQNHNVEVRLYELLKKYDVTDIPTPKIYYTQEFSEDNPLNGYIIMEYIDGTLYHLADNISPEHMSQVMESLAKLQATGMKFTDDAKAHFQNHPYLVLFSKMLNEQGSKGFMTMLRQFGGERMKDKIDHLESVLPEILDIKLIQEMPKSLGMEPFLCHGDLWATNLIWKNGANDLELKAVIDFQNAHFGCPSVDFTRILCACMGSTARKDNWESLLEEFYTYLEKELGGHHMPYTLDMLKKAYRLLFPLGAFLMLPMFGPTFHTINSSTDVDYKTKALMVMFEKAEGLLEDIYDFHQNNKQQR